MDPRSPYSPWGCEELEVYYVEGRDPAAIPWPMEVGTTRQCVRRDRQTMVLEGYAYLIQQIDRWTEDLTRSCLDLVL